ncbi:Hint domain-containing protein [Alphaproteobacteria bacterium KMM 3653]|uniref:Hint domain-containing protein n=1 Tax=Harenicola maris TaxID=2841044 RepID=A0AAP2G6U9_9RHOB|nr:Hint domain-containing protein [Harenicola maris]
MTLDAISARAITGAESVNRTSLTTDIEARSNTERGPKHPHPATRPDRAKRLSQALRRQMDAMQEAPEPGAWLHGAISSTARVLTPSGPRAAGALEAGDLVETKDAGAQPVRWTGRMALTTQQLAASPQICPIRIKPGALSEGFPRKTLEVSPAEQLVMRARTPEAEECLVCASALTRKPGVLRALPRAGFAYVQLMLDAHQVLFVEGVEVESFHPDVLRPSSADRVIWSEVLSVFPDLEHGMDIYGPRVRPQLAARARV